MNKHCILVVDDDNLVRDLLREILKEAGYDVLSASDGCEALQIFSQYESIVKVVLTDIRMPSMDGFELQQRLHSINNKLPIIALSGFVNLSYSKDNDQQFYEFFEKPFNTRQVLNTINMAIGD